MGIGWLWIYTHSDSAETLARENENRAFVIYHRWKKGVQWVAGKYSDFIDSRQKRLSRRTLLTLSDHLLSDIGMFRSGYDIQTEQHGRIKPSAPSKSTTRVIHHIPHIANPVKCEVITLPEQLKITPETESVEPELKSLCR